MKQHIFTPQQICKTLCVNGETKAQKRCEVLFISAILAGSFIALAGVASTWASMLVDNLSLRRLIAGCVFPAGLAMVILTGTELFTGNCLLSVPLLDKRIRLQQVWRNWMIVYTGNCIGAMMVAAAVVYSGVSDGYTEVLVLCAEGKMMSMSDAILRGILCNVLVCMGVVMAAASTDVAGKVLALFFPVAVFVMAGYEHSVANMYYLSAGALAGADLSLYDIVVRNLFPVTVGNIIGGSVVVGGGLWFINHSP